LKSERQSRGGEKQKRKQDDHSKAGAGDWLERNDLHQGRMEEGRGEAETDGGTLKPT
jgi:hypothetical protein